MEKPDIRPVNNLFSSGPCKKRPGWSIQALAGAVLGRSHRMEPAFSRLKQVIEESRKLLELPDDYMIGIVPGSDTGAMEMAMWSVLGARGVDMLVWESFSRDWLVDVLQELRLKDVRTIEADYGMLPDLNTVDFNRDVVFVWNGTTSGVRVPDGNWIDDDRKGLTVCDATSAVFAMDIPWHKLDIITYSWQKVLGGEAAHGMLILSPRAVERMERYRPPWPVPKLFRLTKNGKLKMEIFNGKTINTPSMLCVEDCLDAIQWAESMGGLPGLIDISNRNYFLIEKWVENTEWVEFLCREKEYRSNSSVCLKIISGKFASLPEAGQRDFIHKMITLLEKEKIAYDIKGYRTAPPGLRIWAGATVEPDDIAALLPWLDWAYYYTLDNFKF